MTAAAKSTVVNAGEDQQSGAKMDRATVEAACAAFHAAGAMWGQFFVAVKKKVQAGLWQGVMLMVQRHYDETPLKLRLSAGKNERSSNSAATQETSTHAKLLQAELKLCMLVADCSTVTEEGPRYFQITGRAPTQLSIISANSGECLKQASLNHMELLPGLADMYANFNWVLHQATVDQFAANTRAERSILHDELDREVSSASAKLLKQSRFSKWTPLVCEIE